MSKPVSKGKAPISQKKLGSVDGDFWFDPANGDLTSIPSSVKTQLRDEGYACRLINSKKYQEDRGFHKSGWRVYKFERGQEIGQGSLDFGFGVDAEGYLRRGDLVLAVMPLEMHESHRQNIFRKTKAQMGKNVADAKEIEQYARASGIQSVSIDAGYGDED